MTAFTTRPDLRGDFGMVASTHWLASSVGMSVLERGGNAADAAVAAGFVLQVVEPHLNGPGGEVPILLWDPADSSTRVLAGQGPTPAAATIEHYRSEGLSLVPGTGLLAATVPGAFGAWLLLLERWGSWRLRAVLEPAIHYAEQGYPALPGICATIEQVAGTFREGWPHSAATWLPGGSAPEVGSRLRSPELAATWHRLLTQAESPGASREAEIETARQVFYEGFVAEAIDAHSRQPVRDSSGQPHAGVLRGTDLAAWQCPVEDPVSVDYGEYTVCKTGPWGQGPVFGQQLTLLAGFDLPAAGHLSADYVHTVVECAKLAFADREAWYGDPAEVDVPLAALLSESYAAERRGLVGATASTELRPGSPAGRIPKLPTLPADPASEPAAAGVGEPTVDSQGSTRGDTCHLDVVDRFGMHISATPSGGWLQSSPTIAGLGFALGSRTQMSWLEPGFASSLRPGSRPRTTLSPSLALRDGRPYLAFGTPGGDQQDQWSLLFFLAHVHFGLSLQQAIDAPMLHSTHFPSSFWPRESEPAGLLVEGRLDATVIAELRRRGHRVSVAGDWTLGRLSAAGRDPVTGFLRAAANPRGGYGYAVGR
ncbi:MAG: gamma-glutamyltransferase [Actinomycetota bacterium]|nr:gamma-glutamyltransferase [Actinomycetota bacterium]MDQ2955832.1 gamma-glutamyltransferase [Actinomycetota bacterium]